MTIIKILIHIWELCRYMNRLIVSEQFRLCYFNNIIIVLFLMVYLVVC